jgi:hypothetical protein
MKQPEFSNKENSGCFFCICKEKKTTSLNFVEKTKSKGGHHV